jgi:hypothetical protein
MTLIASRTSAALLGGLLSISTLQGAKAACSAGDIAGAWSMYASHYLKPTTAQPTIMRCNVTLTKTSNSPIKYDADGTCQDYQASADVPIALQIKDGNLTENANTCKVTGTFKIGANPIFPTFTVIEARIESGAAGPRKHIAGIGRVFMGSDNYQLLHFDFVR